MTSVDKVPLLDLTRRSEAEWRELESACQRVLRSGRYILGSEVEALERECAERLGVAGAVGVSSGTDALLIALMALNVGPGDEVICPTYTFFATAGAIARTGATPVFVDSEPDTYNVDPRGVERAVTPRTKVIVPVHLFGQCAEMSPILELAKARGIEIVEDAAQAFGSEYKGERAGALGKIGCFSFFPSKNFGGFGDAGLVTTNDAELAESLRVLRVHGGKPKYHHRVIGGNFRIDALHAALLRVQLRSLEEQTRARQQNARRYDELLAQAGLADRVQSPKIVTGHHIFNQYVIRLASEEVREGLRKFLTENGIGTEVYYPIPLHLQKCFATLGGKLGDHPVAEKAARETLALPIYPALREEEMTTVVGRIAEFFTRVR
jgi:dTDP-4-amino-4,6-dideoxygalactose transaminase